ncbi:MAG TPA: hypothetical protein VFV73_19480 [Streptosporangiaceae bacterium]|nr:hypothetical protein [Streptosporangiaceae bacterium]
MPDGLSSIEGLADKHRRVLDRHHVTDLRGLVQADRRVIYRAMANLRPRPTLELISQWQDEARSMLDELVTDTPDWHTAASFVIVFGQRHHEGAWERRVEVERTEVEPERNPQVWPGWDCVPVCAWMAGQLGQPEAEPPGQPPTQPSAVTEAPLSGEPAAQLSSVLKAPPSGEPVTQPSAEPLPEPPPPASRPLLRIDSAAFVEAAGRTDVVKAGELIPDLRTRFTVPVRVVFTVSGARPGSRLQAVARVQRPDAAGWNAQDPVILSSSGHAEFDLSALPAGDHELSLIAWAPDASAKPVSLRLPPITIPAPRDE